MNPGEPSRVPRWAIAAAFLLFVVLGAATAALGASLPSLRREFGLPGSGGGAAVGAYNLGALVVTLVCGLGERVLPGARRTFAAGLALFVAGAAVAGTAGSWAGFLAGIAVAGAGYGGMVLLLNVRFASGFGARSVLMINLLNALFGLGAMLGPLGVSVAGDDGARPVLLAGALLAVPCGAALWCLTDRPAPPPPGRPPGPGRLSDPDRRLESGRPPEPGRLSGPGRPPGRSRLSGPGRSLGPDRPPEPTRGPLPGEGTGVPGPVLRAAVPFVLVGFLYAGLETAVGTWASTHLTWTGRTAAAGAVVTALFWAAHALGRVVLPLAVRRPRHELFVAGGLAGTVLALALAVVPALAPAGYALAGLALAPVLPTVLAWVAADRPSSQRLITSIVLTGCMVANAAIPTAVGEVITPVEPASVPLALGAVAVVALLAALLPAARSRTRRYAGAAAVPGDYPGTR